MSPRYWPTLVGVVSLAAPGIARGQEPPLPVKPPPIATGVVPLPQGTPQIGPSPTLPTPIKALPDAENPLAWSPNMDAIADWVKQRPLTLNDALAIALYTSKPFASAVASLQVASARTGQARANDVPTVGLSGSLPYFDKATTAAFGGGAPILLNPQFNPTYTAAIRLPIDIAGVVRSAVSQAAFNEVAARVEVNRVRNQVVYDVKNAFFGVLRAQAQVGVATDNVNNALERLSFANKNYAAGTSSRFDVLTAQRDVADAQQGLIVARSAVSVAIAGLKSTIGIDIRTRIRVADTDAVAAPTDVAPTEASGPKRTAPSPERPAKADGVNFPLLKMPATDTVEDNFDFGPEYDSLLKEALQTRPEVLEAEAQVSAAKKGVQYARRSTLPNVSLGLSHVYTPNATAFTRVDQTIVSMDISIPIFDGGMARERVREARGQVALAEVNRRSVTDQVQVDVQQAFIALVQARQRVAVTNVEVAQARETLRVGRLRYSAGVSQQVGVSPQIELSNSQLSLTQALTNQVNALYDYNVAKAQLDRALGRYAFTGGAPGYPAVPPQK